MSDTTILILVVISMMCSVASMICVAIVGFIQWSMIAEQTRLQKNERLTTMLGVYDD